MHAWFDISAGVAGDMLLGALLDAGADATAVQTAIDAIAPGSVRLESELVTRGGQRGVKARVRVLVPDPPHRRWASIQTTLRSAELAEQTRAWALAAFARLADAEARAHGIDAEDVHFHEVGALDSIADVVGTCEALRTLEVSSVSASPVRLGAGRVRAAHGDIPVPVPAVAELAIGWQVYATPERDAAHDHEHAHGREHVPAHDHGPSHDHDHGRAYDHGHAPHPHDTHHDAPAVVTTAGSVGELATPTGLALIRALASTCEPLPSLTVSAVGVGAGGKDVAGWPNVVRVVVGEPVGGDRPATELVELRANIDDLDPRLWPGVLDACLDAGAVDAWLVPIVMKKGRPAHTLHALADAEHRAGVVETILTRTSTLGVREDSVHRTVVDRSWVNVPIEGSSVAIKVGHRSGRVVQATPEFSSVVALAATLRITESEALQRATGALASAGLLPGRSFPAAN